MLPLPQLMIGTMIGVFGAVFAGNRLALEFQDAAAVGTGTYILAVKGAMDGVIAGHFLALSRGEPLQDATGSNLFADPAAPTIAELKAAGHLPASFPVLAPANVAVRVQLLRDAASCPGVGCRIEALVYTTAPLRIPGNTQPNYEMAAAAVRAMQGFGGAAWDADTDTIRGSAFELNNPVGGVGGVVGAVAMLDTTMWNQFVRIGDDRDPALQGNLSAQGAASFATVGMRDTVVPLSTCTATNFANPSNPATGAISYADNVEYAKTAAGGIAACVGGRWIAVASVGQAGQACGAGYPEGAVANTGSGEGLICRDGTWTYMSQWLSRHVRMAAYLIPQTLTNAQTNNAVPRPACGTSGGVPGTPNVQMIPQSIQNRGSFALNGVRSGDTMTVTGTMTLEPTNFPTTVSGANWLVRVPPNSQAIVETYCTYM